MIDTIRGYSYEVDDIGKLGRFEITTQYENKTSYKVENFAFWVNHPQGVLSGIGFEGSIPKLVFANNFRNSNRLTIGEGILKLERLTGLGIRNYNVTRIDIAANIPVKYDVITYIKKMDYMPSYRRSKKYTTSRYFYNGSRTLFFYDKMIEVSKKGELKNVPKHIIPGRNVLRIEFRAFGNIKKLLKQKMIRMKDLFDPDIYLQFPIIWEKKYNAVHKIHIPSLENTHSWKDIEGFHFSRSLYLDSDKDTLVNQLNQLYAIGEMTKNQRKYAGSALIKLLRSKTQVDPDKLIAELDDKVSKMKEFLTEYPAGNGYFN